MSEDFNLPVGVVGKVVMLSDSHVHFAYSEESEIVGDILSGEECYFYKEIDGWILIGSHQWIPSESTSLKKGIVEPVSNKEVVEEVKETSENAVSKEDVNEEEVETQEENVKPNNSLFKRIGKIFSKK